MNVYSDVTSSLAKWSTQIIIKQVDIHKSNQENIRVSVQRHIFHMCTFGRNQKQTDGPTGMFSKVAD